jgi:hypothetical protein
MWFVCSQDLSLQVLPHKNCRDWILDFFAHEPSNEAYAEQLHKLHENSQKKILSWLFRFPLNLCHSSSKKDRSSNEEIHCLLFLETTCSISHLLPSLKERVAWIHCYTCMVLIVCCFVRWGFCISLWTANWHKASIQAPILSNFFSVNTEHFHILMFTSNEPVIQNFSTILRIVLTHSSADVGFSFLQSL